LQKYLLGNQGDSEGLLFRDQEVDGSNPSPDQFFAHPPYVPGADLKFWSLLGVHSDFSPFSRPSALRALNSIENLLAE
jgi:hypothetical protein